MKANTNVSTTFPQDRHLMFRFLGSLALVGGIIIIWQCLSYPGDAGFEKVELIVGAVVSGAGIALLYGLVDTPQARLDVVGIRVVLRFCTHEHSGVSGADERSDW